MELSSPQIFDKCSEVELIWSKWQSVLQYDVLIVIPCSIYIARVPPTHYPLALIFHSLSHSNGK